MQVNKIAYELHQIPSENVPQSVTNYRGMVQKDLDEMTRVLRRSHGLPAFGSSKGDPTIARLTTRGDRR